MSSMAISGANASNAVQTAYVSTSVAVQSQPKAPAVLEPDTLKLTAAGQAKSMYGQGQSVSLIAASLGTDVASVDGYLNITVAVAPAATPAPHAALAAAKGTAAPTAQASPTAQAAKPAQAATTAVAITAAKG